MTKEQWFDIMVKIKSYYPKAFENKSDSEFKRTCADWYELFKDDDYELVKVALKRHVTSSRFAPTPYDLKDAMLNARPIHQKDIGEAWDMVVRSARCDIKLAQEEYDKLPSNIQKALGSALFLREVGYADNDELKFHRKDFEKRYETILTREKNDVSMGILSIEQASKNNVIGLTSIKLIGGGDD